MTKKKRYEVLYINPNFCDGFWDNEETRYLNIDEIKEKIYENLENEEIESILNRNEEIKENDGEEMSGVKLALQGLGLAIYGIINIIWVLIKIISSVFIAGLISTKLGLVGNYWWFGAIIIFSVLCRLVIRNNTNDTYSDLVDNYQEKVKEE